MPGKADSIEIERFAFVPVRRAIHRGNRWYFGVVAGDDDPKHQVMVKRYRIQVIDHFHGTGLRSVVEAGEAGEHIEIAIGIALQKRAHITDMLRSDHDGTRCFIGLKMVIPRGAKLRYKSAELSHVQCHLQVSPALSAPPGFPTGSFPAVSKNLR